MFTLTTLSSPGRSSAILSRTGETAWQGPHHSAQKSTITGLSLERTSCSKVDSVTAVDMRILSLVPLGIPAAGENVPIRSNGARLPGIPFVQSPDGFRVAPGGPRPLCARARDSRVVGARGHLRRAA